MYTGKTSENYRLFLCSDDAKDVSVCLNGYPMTPLADEPNSEGFPPGQSSMPVRYCRRQFDQVVRYACASSPDHVRSGYNIFQIHNESSAAYIISWIEVETE